MGRYLLSWLWFIPALIAANTLQLHTSGAYTAALLVGVLGYACLSVLLPQQQFLHDRLCQTRLVNWRPAPKRRHQG
jgi:ABC-type transport system involved in cytochrome c biogenesis permease subunit